MRAVVVHEPRDWLAISLGSSVRPVGVASDIVCTQYAPIRKPREGILRSPVTISSYNTQHLTNDITQ